MENKYHYIKVPVSCYSGSKCNLAPKYVKEAYDYEVSEELMTSIISNDIITPALGYDALYNHILKYKKDNMENKIVTIGGDSSIWASTIPAINENYMKTIGQSVESPLYVIIVSAKPCLHNFSTYNNTCMDHMSIASVLGITDPPLVNFKLLLQPQQIIYIGLRDMDNTEAEILDDLGIVYYNMNKIKSLGMDVIVDSIKEVIGDSPVHLAISLTSFDPSVVPCVTHVFNDGLLLGDMELITKKLSKSTVSLDIVDFDTNIGSERQKNRTGEYCRRIIVNLFDIKEKKINIFNEDSEFIIYRIADQVDDDTDYGWYIMRGLDMETKSDLLEKIKDNVIDVEIDGEDYLVTKTTVNEQQNKNYYSSNKITDFVLTPQEKEHMMFELIN